LFSIIKIAADEMRRELACRDQANPEEQLGQIGSKASW
jgi:hypothetical protein